MKKPMTIAVEGVGLLGRPEAREYRIGFVSNWFTVNYFDLKREALKAQQAYYDMTMEQEKLARGETTVEAVTKAVEDAKDVIYATGTREFFERRLDLVREALETNGIEFDRKAWERHTSPKDLIGFLDAVYAYGTKAEEPDGEEKSKKAR